MCHRKSGNTNIEMPLFYLSCPFSTVVATSSALSHAYLILLSVTDVWNFFIV